MGMHYLVDSIAYLKAHDVCVVAHELGNQILLTVAPCQHPGLTVAELLRLHTQSPLSRCTHKCIWSARFSCLKCTHKECTSHLRKARSQHAACYTHSQGRCGLPWHTGLPAGCRSAL